TASTWHRPIHSGTAEDFRRWLAELGTRCRTDETDALRKGRVRRIQQGRRRDRLRQPRGRQKPALVPGGTGGPLRGPRVAARPANGAVTEADTLRFLLATAEAASDGFSNERRDAGSDPRSANR